MQLLLFTLEEQGRELAFGLTARRRDLHSVIVHPHSKETGGKADCRR